MAFFQFDTFIVNLSLYYYTLQNANTVTVETLAHHRLAGRR